MNLRSYDGSGFKWSVANVASRHLVGENLGLGNWVNLMRDGVGSTRNW